MNQAGARDCEAAGFVLAGGRSSRMGREKALVALSRRPLIAHAIGILRSVGLPPSIAGAQSDLKEFAPVIRDENPGTGPLAGVCAGLAATSARHAVFLSIDLPFVPASLIAFLLHHARVTGRAVTVASTAGFAQTFPCVIAREALPALESEMRAGRSGCFAAFEEAAESLGQSVVTVAAELVAQSGHVNHSHGLSPAQWFLNLNMPADLDRAEALWHRRIA
jgi:molybdenum cofactor guanylyltransferase